MNETDPLSEPNQSTTQTEEQVVAAPSAAADPMREMRLLLYALLAAVLLVSISLNLFMYRQNQRTQLELENANNQITAIEQNPTLQQNRTAMQNLLNEVASQASTHPEVQQILARYNLSVQQPQPAAQQPAVAPAKK
jgi:uncharacterized protein HemX